MASSLPTFSGVARSLTSRRKMFRTLRARAESSTGGDEGNSSISIVDANLGVLKERIGMVRMEERLERWREARSSGGDVGWMYSSAAHDSKMSNLSGGNKLVAESSELAGLVVGTFGFTILSCTLCLCLVSFVLHLG